MQSLDLEVLGQAREWLGSGRRVWLVTVSRGQFSGATPIIERYGVNAEEARRFGLPCGGNLEVVIESELHAVWLGELHSRIASGEVVVRAVDEWRFRTASPTDATTCTERELACVHGPRWRLLIIGASEIARYLAEGAAGHRQPYPARNRHRNTRGADSGKEWLGAVARTRGVTSNTIVGRMKRIA